MTVLKAKEFARSDLPAGPLNLSDIAAEAQQIIDSAKQQKLHILAQVEKQATEIRQEAHEQGYQQGHQQGVEQGQKTGHGQALQQAREEFQKQTADLQNALQQTLNHFDATKGHLLWRAEQETLILAIAIAEKVVKTTGLNDRRVAAENVKAALELIARNTDVIIKLNPKDIDHLQQLTQNTDFVPGKYSSLRFQPEETITPGGCSIHTEHGQIDAALDTQLARIANELVMSQTNTENTDGEENNVAN